ncbi:MAG TPA: HAMP domain-containing sensor histidine kinase [Acidimicrobiales bacterium]|nr:HAMP domain-containing sensor histidine kinase [Acidimicrobiales bacterium]
MADPAPSASPSRFPRRLRNRIVVRIGLLVAGLAVAVGLSTYAIVSDTLEREKERSAEEQFRSNASALDAALGTGADVDPLAVLTSLRPEVRAGELLWAHGRWFAASSQLRPEDLPAALVGAVQAGEPASARFESTSGPLLAFGAPLDGGRRYFEVFDLQELEDTLGTLRRALAASGLLATLAAVAVAWLIARRVTAPLEGVANAATRIASGDLDVRMAGSDDRDLGRIAASFNRMADTLQARLARESRFAADVSHELRSPMTTLVNAATVLQRRRHELSGDGQEALDLLVGDVERFERIIADLTEMSKHDAGTIRPEREVLPAAAVRDAIRRISGSVPVEVHDGAEGALVLVDLQLLERVLHTVLENADAYAGGACAIHVDADEASVLVHVDDEGPGVPVDERERIFERFARGVHGERRTTADGSGLGLSLASENMRALGGSVTVGDNPGGTGARFTLSLPRAGA